MRGGKPSKSEVKPPKRPILERRAEKKAKEEAKALAEVKAKQMAEVKARERRIAEAVRGGKEVAVNPDNLAPNNSYGVPDFVERGTYRDRHFSCKDCGKSQVWTASQQKWWHEVAKGHAYATAIRCRPCRKKRRGEVEAEE